MSNNKLDRPLRRVDARGELGGAGAPLDVGGAPLGAAVALPPPPEQLVVTGSALVQSAVTPRALVNLAWRAPAAFAAIDGYRIQWSTSSGFSAPVTSAAPAGATSAALGDLPAGAAIWIRAATVAPEGVVGPWGASVSTTTPADTTPPAAPTGLAASWQRTGDLLLTWLNPASANLRDVRVQIYTDSGKGTLLTEAFSTTGRYAWTLAENLRATSGSPRASVYVELRARSWGGVLSASGPALTTAKSPPAQPAAPAVDFAGPDLLMTWAAAADALTWAVTVRGQTYTVSEPRLAYTFAQNQSDGGGAASASLAYSVVALDGLGLSSPSRIGVATNAPPAATTVSAVAGFSELALSVAPSAARDLRDYRVRVYRDATLIRTIFTTETLLRVAAEGGGSYRADVTVFDVFGQASAASAQTAPATLEDQAQFAAALRAGAIYRDVLGTDPAALRAQLSDGMTTGAGISYARDGAWRWTEVRRDVLDRYQPLLLSISAPAVVAVYVATSQDGAAWQWWSGPLTSGRILSSVAGEAAAQSAAPTVAGDASMVRLDLPALVEARFVRLYHGSPGGGTYSLREWYAERVVEGDLIRAASIKTLHLAAGSVAADQIAAGAVTAGKISVTQLSAISANMGTITAGTITGALIRTAATGQRVELDSTGLRTHNSAGQVQVEATTATDGELRAGQGAVVLNRNGIFVDPSAVGSISGYALRTSAGLTVGVYSGAVSGGARSLAMRAEANDAARDSLVLAQTWANAARVSRTRLRAQRGHIGAPFPSPSSTITLDVESSPAREGVFISGGDGLTVEPGGLNVGTESGAAPGQVRASAGVVAGGRAAVNGAGDNAGVGLHVRCVLGLVGLRVVTAGGGSIVLDVWDTGAVFAPNLRVGASGAGAGELFVDANGFVKRA